MIRRNVFFLLLTAAVADACTGDRLLGAGLGETQELLVADDAGPCGAILARAGANVRLPVANGTVSTCLRAVSVPSVAPYWRVDFTNFTATARSGTKKAEGAEPSNWTLEAASAADPVAKFERVEPAAEKEVKLITVTVAPTADLEVNGVNWDPTTKSFELLQLLFRPAVASCRRTNGPVAAMGGGSCSNYPDESCVPNTGAPPLQDRCEGPGSVQLSVADCSVGGVVCGAGRCARRAELLDCRVVCQAAGKRTGFCTIADNFGPDFCECTAD